MMTLVRALLLSGIASTIFTLGACTGGRLECGPGTFPRGDECVPFSGDGGDPPRGDASELDVGPSYVDAGDAGTPVPFDGSVYDSGFTEPPALVTLGERGRILLTGAAVLTMNAMNPIAPGEVYIQGDRIRCVGARDACAAMSGGATIVETNGVILPGLIDSHNHVAYDWMHEWNPGRIFGDHSDWQGAAEYSTFIDPYRQNSGDEAKQCAMVQWGELRALAAGTTTMYGAVDSRQCWRWLVRNAELSPTYNGFPADRMRSNVLGIGTVNQTEATDLIADMQSGMVTAYMIHVAEGITTRARGEYEQLVQLSLLRPETVIIHGTALTAMDFETVAAAGAKLVWSPSSNMVLYGETTDVEAAINAGVPVSIAPDWTPSGEGTLLPELRFARSYLEGRAPGLLTDRELLEAITRVPAENMAVAEHIGTLEVGKLADILVLAVDDAFPYSSSINARSHHIRLVMIGGIPSYGDPAIVGAMRETPAACFDLPVCNVVRRVCWEEPAQGGPVTPASIEAAIKAFYPEGPLGLFYCD